MPTLPSAMAGHKMPGASRSTDHHHPVNTNTIAKTPKTAGSRRKTKATKASQTSSAPQVTDQAFIRMKSLRQSIRERRIPLIPFRLLNLPQEIIDMIYAQMIRVGDVQILRASREVYARASQLVLPHGFQRTLACEVLIPATSVLVPNWLFTREVTAMQSLDAIKNLEIRITNLVYYTYIGIGGYVEAFTGSQIHRDTCNIIIEFDITEPELYWTWHWEKNLTGFKYLTVVFTGYHERLRPVKCVRPWSVNPKAIYELVKKELEPTLGPAKVMLGPLRGLEFRPLEYERTIPGVDAVNGVKSSVV